MGLRTLQLVKLPAAVTVAGLLLGGCVSDTLSTQQTQPQPLAEPQTAEVPSYDPAQREQAIAEIREKAAQPGSGELTNAYAEANGPNEPLTAQQQAEKIRQLEQSAAQNNENVTDGELAAQHRSIRELQNKARTHYDSAINQITN